MLAPRPDAAIPERRVAQASAVHSLLRRNLGNYQPALALCGVMALAAVLRLYNLGSRGLIYWDEAKFGLEGERLHAALQGLVGAHIYLGAGKAIGTAKPTHALLIALVYLILGVHDYAPLILNAMASVAGVGLTYVIARRLVRPMAAIGAAALLAVSEYDVIYARSALSESDATAFFLAGVALWLGGRRATGKAVSPQRSLPLFPGLLFGAAFTTNYRMVVYVSTVVALDLVLRSRESGWRDVGLAAFGWIASIAALPAGWQIVDLITHAHGLTLFRSELTGAWSPYLQQAWYQLREGKQSAFHFQPLPYLDWFVLREGWPISVLSLVGLAMAAVRRTERWLVPATLVVAPYMVFVFAPFYVPRNLVPALPFVSILCAGALDALVSRWRRDRRIILAIGVALLMVLGAWMSWRLTAVRSGFASAAGYLRAHQAHALTTTEIMVFYNPGGVHCDAPALPVDVRAIPAYVSLGYAYAVVERHHESVVEAYIRSHARLVAGFEAVGPLNIGENLIASENSKTPQQDSRPEWVSVYRIAQMKVPGTGRERALACDRDRVT